MVASRLGSRLDGFLLDFKLAVRMLARYPLLTIVGGAGMAFGLAASIGGYEVRTKMIDPRLPLHEGWSPRCVCTTSCLSTESAPTSGSNRSMSPGC